MCWGVEWSRMLNLSMSFGQPRLEVVMEPHKTQSRDADIRRMARRRLISIKGKWWLWVLLARWEILHDGVCLVNSRSSMAKKHDAFADLTGQKLLNIWLLPDKGCTCFEFDLNTTLRITRMGKANKDEVWCLSEPCGYCFSLYADGTFLHEPGSGLDKRRACAGELVPGGRRL